MATTVNCPRCGAPYEIAGEVADDKHLLCMACGEKFSSRLCAKTMATPPPPATAKCETAPPTPRPASTPALPAAAATVVEGSAGSAGAAAATLVGAADNLIGKTIGGCRIEKKLGQGGMGAVYLAKHLALDIPVAIKILPPQFAEANPGAIERFIREARAAARLQHQNIVGVMNVGQEEGLYFIVMQYVDGGSLQALLRKKGRLPWRQAVDLIAQICEALKVARENGVVHRDIKPDNIMLDSKGVAKLADLGLAKFRQEDTAVTQSGMAMGTPHYMAPEQAEDAKNADHRSDIYSLGCTLYHMLVGKTPYSGESVFKILQQHVAAPIPDPRAEVADIPEALCAVLRKAMAKKPAERFQSAAEFQAALKQVRAGQTASPAGGAAAAKTAVAAAPVSAKASDSGRQRAGAAPAASRKSTRILPPMAAPPTPADWWRDNLPALVGVGAAVVILAGIAVGWALSSSPKPETVAVTLSPAKALLTEAAKPKAVQPGTWREPLAKATAAWEENRFAEALAAYEAALKSMESDTATDRLILEESRRTATSGRDLCRFCLDRAAAPLEVKLQVTAKKLSELNNNADIVIRSHKCENEEIAALDLAEQPALVNLQALRGLMLTELNLAKTGVSDLSALVKMPLRILNLSGSAIKDLASLKGLPLAELNLSDTPIADLTPLAGLPLRKLIISRTAVASLAPLKGMTIEDLQAEHCRIADIAALKGMPLKHLALAGNPLRDLEPLRGMALETLTLDPEVSEASKEILRDLPTLSRINGKEVAEIWREQGAESSGKEAAKEEKVVWPPAEGKTVDLLPWLKPDKHTAIGAWQAQADPREIRADGNACLIIPYRPGTEYDVRLLFATPAGNRLLFVVLTVPERKRAFAFVIKGRDTCGFEAISGGLVPQNSSTEKMRKAIGGAEYALALQVRKTGVQAFLDGEAIADYKTTTYAPFTLPKAYPPPVAECLEIGCGGGLIIRRLEAIEVNGEGEILDIAAQPYIPPVEEPKPAKDSPKEPPKETPKEPPGKKPKSAPPRSDHRSPPSSPSSPRTPPPSPPSHGGDSPPPSPPKPPPGPPPPPRPPR
ncbi:MAG: protein kinase [Planctomycetota bacterium]|nr:protein kinase [Planctomycetota bacterium]